MIRRRDNASRLRCADHCLKKSDWSSLSLSLSLTHTKEIETLNLYISFYFHDFFSYWKKFITSQNKKKKIQCYQRPTHSSDDKKLMIHDNWLNLPTDEKERKKSNLYLILEPFLVDSHLINKAGLIDIPAGTTRRLVFLSPVFFYTRYIIYRKKTIFMFSQWGFYFDVKRIYIMIWRERDRF